MKHIVVALAAFAAAVPAAARQPDITRVPAVVAVQNQLSALCRAQGRRPLFNADFYFSIDGDDDGRADDIMLIGDGFECLSRRANADPTHPASGRQWLILHGPRGYRQVWIGTRPRFYNPSQHVGLYLDEPCRTRCEVYWDGHAFLPVRRPRPR